MGREQIKAAFSTYVVSKGPYFQRWKGIHLVNPKEPNRNLKYHLFRLKNPDLSFYDTSMTLHNLK